MFLKEKSDGTLKGKGCADGGKQRSHYDQEDATSPTVALKSVLLTSVIDAKEGYHVSVGNIPGAYLSTE